MALIRRVVDLIRKREMVIDQIEGRLAISLYIEKRLKDLYID